MTSFAQDIAPLFREQDVSAMDWMFDLSDRDDVEEHADAILDVVSEGTMPCDRQWPQESVALFRAWKDEGCPA